MPDVNIIVKAKDEATRVLKGINNSLFGFNDTLLKIGVVGAPVLAGVGVAIGKLAYDAAQVEPTVITFEMLTEQIGSSADAMLDELRPATMGVMRDIDLMKAANKLMMMGLADSEEEAANLAEIAVKLGMAMGTDALPALESFTLMLANQSILRMDTFGLSSGKAREEINKLVDEGLSREEAFKLVVLDQGNDRLKDLGEFSDTAKVKMAKLNAKFGNVKDTLGEALLPSLEILLEDALIPIADVIAEDLAPLLAETLPGAIQATISAFQTLGDLIGDILDAIERLDKWTAEHLAAPEMRGWRGRAAVGQATAEQPRGWQARAGGTYNVNVYGLPGLENQVRNIINQEGAHTVGSIGGP